MSRRSGVSFVELILVLLIVAILTGTGTVYYRGLIDQANEERCRIDMRTFKKAIMKLETDQKVTIRPFGPHPQMEPAGLGVNPPPAPPEDPGGFIIPRLLDFRLITKLPADPWDMDYQIDIPGGKLFSNGPDRIADTGDEIKLEFRPPFEPLRASIADDRKSVTVEFSRKIDPFTLYRENFAELPFQIDLDSLGAAAPTAGTTVARVMTNPFAVIIRLPGALPVPADPVNQPHLVHILATPGLFQGNPVQFGGMDTSVLLSDQIEKIEEF